MLLDITRWKTNIKLFLYDDLCVFKSLKRLEIVSFWRFWVVFSRNGRFLERIKIVQIFHTLHFLSCTTSNKSWKFQSILFVGTVFSPPPYETRSLCSVNKITKRSPLEKNHNTSFFSVHLLHKVIFLLRKSKNFVS